MDVVLIPCYNRPEFLKVCLEHIKKANGADKLHYHFAVEYNADTDILKIVDMFPYSKSVATRTERVSRGNQMNVVGGYKEALKISRQKASKLIFNIEPDIFIAKGFFDFHHKAHELVPNSFSVSACHNQNWTTKVPNYLDKVYLHSSFQSLGISFNMNVMKMITPHANELYYREPGRYLDVLKFPTSKRLGMHYEQAGLIHRIQEFSGLSSVYTTNPLAYHAGFYGVNRPGDILTGSTEEKAAQLMKMTQDEMNNRAKKYKDIKAIDLNQECPDSLSLFEFPPEIPIVDDHTQNPEGYDSAWLKRGIKVKSKPQKR